MKLRTFDAATRELWIKEGYSSVKITASEHLSVNEVEPEPFFLLEPYNSIIDVGDGDLVQNIAAPAIEEIIEKGNGRYYQ